MNILDLVSLHTIKVPLEATTKKEAIDELIDLLAAAGLVSDAEDLRNVVWEREQQRSTGIGEGLAIPHAKCGCTDRLVMAIGLPAEPIEFDSIDRKPVRMIVLLASPPDRTGEHIQALGKISRIMNKPGFRERAFDVDSADALIALFEQEENVQVKT